MRLARRFVAAKIQSRGFTIVELMIATLVFSVILLIVTGGIVQVTRTYYKGVTEANTQTAARNVIDAISQAIQFNGGAVQPPTGSAPGTSYEFCVGSTRFRFMLGSELSTSPSGTQTHHVALEDTTSNCLAGATSSINTPTATGTELLSPRMRLSALGVTDLGNNLYKITVRVAYGDDDLLNSPSSPTAACLGVQAGTQYCSIVELSTTVLKRI